MSGHVLTSPTSAPLRPLVYDVQIDADNLVALCDELCADSFSLCDDSVTFTARQGREVVRWQGTLGHRGLVQV